MKRRADEHTDIDIENDNRALKCPRCGSHTLRAFDFTGSEASLKCLTCGNEFERPAMSNPEAKVADSHKFTPGTRVQMDHQNHKGQRGTIVDYSGKLADLDEEQYVIQLDNGEKIENIPESAFNKIKSARVIVGNDNLPDTPGDKFFLDSKTFTFEAAGPPGDSKKPKMLPLTEWDENKTEEDYDPDAMDHRWDEPEDEPVICPMCQGPGTDMGSFGARTYYRCRNCGMDFSQLRQDHAEQWNYDGDPDNLFGQDKPGDDTTYSKVSPIAGIRNVTKRRDSKGNKLEAGRVYLMSGGNYTVPDLVRILNLEDDKIEAAIASDAKGAFPIIIEAGQESDYSFEPVEAKVAIERFTPGETVEVYGQSPSGQPMTGQVERLLTKDDPDYQWGNIQLRASGQPAYLVRLDNGSIVVTQQIKRKAITDDAIYDGLKLPTSKKSAWKISRKDWSAQEQRELVDENPKGRARNMDKLDLSGTHYELKSASDDPDFLWG